MNKHLQLTLLVSAVLMGACGGGGDDASTASGSSGSNGSGSSGNPGTTTPTTPDPSTPSPSTPITTSAILDLYIPALKGNSALHQVLTTLEEDTPVAGNLPTRCVGGSGTAALTGPNPVATGSSSATTYTDCVLSSREVIPAISTSYVFERRLSGSSTRRAVSQVGGRRDTTVLFALVSTETVTPVGGSAATKSTRVDGTVQSATWYSQRDIRTTGITVTDSVPGAGSFTATLASQGIVWWGSSGPSSASRRGSFVVTPTSGAYQGVAIQDQAGTNLEYGTPDARNGSGLTRFNVFLEPVPISGLHRVSSGSAALFATYTRAIDTSAKDTVALAFDRNNDGCVDATLQLDRAQMVSVFNGADASSLPSPTIVSGACQPVSSLGKVDQFEIVPIYSGPSSDVSLRVIQAGRCAEYFANVTKSPVPTVFYVVGQGAPSPACQRIDKRTWDYMLYRFDDNAHFCGQFGSADYAGVVIEGRNYQTSPPDWAALRNTLTTNYQNDVTLCGRPPEE